MFVIALLVFFALMSWLVLFHYAIIHRVLELYDIPDMNYKLLLVTVAALNFFICYLLEVKTNTCINTCNLERDSNISNCKSSYFSLQTLIDRGALNCLRNLRGKRESKKLYKRLDVQLAETPSWPPLNQTVFPPQCSVIGVS